MYRNPEKYNKTSPKRFFSSTLGKLNFLANAMTTLL